LTDLIAKLMADFNVRSQGEHCWFDGQRPRMDFWDKSRSLEQPSDRRVHLEVLIKSNSGTA
jgi:hypothetical protein